MDRLFLFRHQIWPKWVFIFMPLYTLLGGGGWGTVGVNLYTPTHMLIKAPV